VIYHVNGNLSPVYGVAWSCTLYYLDCAF